LQPAAQRIQRDGIAFNEPVDLAEYLAADIELRFGRAADKAEVLLLRGGRLDDGLRTSPVAVRELLLGELDLAEKSGVSTLALPASFPDWDGNGAFSAGKARTLAGTASRGRAGRTKATLHGGSRHDLLRLDRIERGGHRPRRGVASAARPHVPREESLPGAVLGALQRLPGPSDAHGF
jgi:hypothetical protein